MGVIFALFYPFLIIAYALLLGAFIASLVVLINNLRTGGKSGWPIKNRVGGIISGLVLLAVTIATIILMVYTVDLFSSSTPTSSSAPTSSAALALMVSNL